MGEPRSESRAELNGRTMDLDFPTRMSIKSRTAYGTWRGQPKATHANVVKLLSPSLREA